MGFDRKLDRIGFVKYIIVLGDVYLIFFQKIFCKKKEIVDNGIDKMLDDDIKEFSIGFWVSFILLVKKKDGLICFCIDYRKINVVVKKNVYLFFRFDECLELLLGLKFMCIIDLVFGYW